MQIMNCWPSTWISAAKNAGLSSGADASTGQFFVIGGDQMRRSLEVFAKDIADAERERCAKICEMHAWEWEHSAGHPTEALKEAARKIRD